MAAPANTIWGSAVYDSAGHGSKLGVYIKNTGSTDTHYIGEAQIWYWARYAITDAYNTLYHNVNNKGLPTTNSKKTTVTDISIKVTSQSSWSTSNQKLIRSIPIKIERTKAKQSKYISASLHTIEYGGGTPSVKASFSINPKTSYTITYKDEKSSTVVTQKKWHGGSVTARTTYFNDPTGYNPALNKNGKKYWLNKTTGTTYQVGVSITENRSQTLYAQWVKETYTINFNANGGSGAPASKTKTYGVALDLSTLKQPTRATKVVRAETESDNSILYKIEYTFLGWSLSKTGDVLKNLNNYTLEGNRTLYAIWDETKIGTVYTAKYNTNGGVPSVDSHEKIAGVEVYLSPVIPRKEGYRFSGWKDQDGRTYENLKTDKWTENKNLTLTACYKLINNTLKFHGTKVATIVNIESENIATILQDEAEEIIIIPENYEVIGWQDKTYNRFFSVDAVYDIIDGDDTIEFYPVWKRKNVRFYEMGECQAGQFVEKNDADSYIINENGIFIGNQFIEKEDLNKINLTNPELTIGEETYTHAVAKVEKLKEYVYIGVF